MVRNVYFLAVHAPREEPGAPEPVNGLIVHATALLNPDLPQPDAALVYRCLTEFPGRTPGGLVPLSTLGCELDGGRLWRKVADWPRVIHVLEGLARSGTIDRVPLSLTDAEAVMLAADPHEPMPAHRDGLDRCRLLDSLAAVLPEAVGGPPLSPGESLIEPPPHPSVMPFRPHAT